MKGLFWVIIPVYHSEDTKLEFEFLRLGNSISTGKLGKTGSFENYFDKSLDVAARGFLTWLNGAQRLRLTFHAHTLAALS